MNNPEFRKKIYNPYLEAWKIMKLVQYGQHFGTDDLWDKFVREAERLNHAYPRNKYIDQLCQLLLTAGEYIAAENSKTE